MGKISILMPIYNAEKYLKECFESIRKQSYDDFEVLMVDDGSTDKSGEICDHYCLLDNRFKVKHQINQGSGIARNNAIEWAMTTDSEYIAWVDADDLISLDFLQVMLHEIENNPNCDIVQCGYTSDYQTFLNNMHDEKVVFYSKDVMLKELHGVNQGIAFTLLWNKLYKKQLYQNVRVIIDDKISGRMQDDVNILWQIYVQSKGCSEIKTIKYYYRVVSNSIQHKKISSKNLEFLWIYEKLYQYSIDHKMHSYAQFLSERMFFEFAKTLGHRKEAYENYLIFYKAAKDNYLELNKRIDFQCRRIDLKITRLLSKLCFAFIPLYGWMYLQMRKFKRIIRQ